MKVGYDDCQCFSLPCWFEDQLLEGWADGDDLFIIKIVLVPSNDASRFRMKNFKLIDGDSDVLNESILLLRVWGRVKRTEYHLGYAAYFDMTWIKVDFPLPAPPCTIKRGAVGYGIFPFLAISTS